MKNKNFNPKKIVDFMILAGKLKWTKRTGWLRERMPEPETVAEHTFRVAILCRVLATFLDLNAEKLTSMAIFHDLSEGVLGDPVVQRGKKQVADTDRENEAKFIKKAFNELGMPELYQIWEENIQENGPHKTLYSDAHYQIGKIATVWQAFEYELRGVPRERTEEFWENATYHVHLPILKQILSSLKQLRRSYRL